MIRKGLASPIPLGICPLCLTLSPEYILRFLNVRLAFSVTFFHVSSRFSYLPPCFWLSARSKKTRR